VRGILAVWSAVVAGRGEAGRWDGGGWERGWSWGRRRRRRGRGRIWIRGRDGWEGREIGVGMDVSGMVWMVADVGAGREVGVYLGRMVGIMADVRRGLGMWKVGRRIRVEVDVRRMVGMMADVGRWMGVSEAGRRIVMREIGSCERGIHWRGRRQDRNPRGIMRVYELGGAIHIRKIGTMTNHE
jgi:hypothetical protein